MLFILPKRHWLVYGSCYMLEVIDKCKQPYHSIEVLIGDEAVPENIDKAVDRLDPAFIFGIGHGDVDAYTVECTKPYLTYHNQDRLYRFSSGRVIHLNSCKVGAGLSRDLVRLYDAVAFFGSVSPFWFYPGLPPCSDEDPIKYRASRSTFIPEYRVTEVIMRRGSIRDAHETRMRSYDEEIEFWLTGDGKDFRDAPILVRILEIDKAGACVYSKDFSYVPSPRPTPRFVAPVRTLIPFIAGAVSLIIGKETKTS